MAAYGRLLLAPVEGWWPSVKWRDLWALLSFRCLGTLQALLKVDGIILKETRKLFHFLNCCHSQQWWRNSGKIN